MVENDGFIEDLNIFYSLFWKTWTLSHDLKCFVSLLGQPYSGWKQITVTVIYLDISKYS